MRFLGLPGFDLGTDPDVAATCWAEMEVEFGHSQGAAKRALVAIGIQVQERVQRYVTTCGDPERLGGSPFARKAAAASADLPGDLLYARYRSGGSTDSTIVDIVTRQVSPYCAFCGLRMRRKPHHKKPDRDHILPRSKFPEFSILRLNLIPLCDNCNDAKGDRCVDEHGKRIFLHPYFDDFLADRILDATVLATDSEIEIAYPRRPLDSPETTALVERHMNALDVEASMVDEVLPQLLLLLKQHLRALGDGGAMDTAHGMLTDSARAVLAVRPNDPLGLVLEAVATGDLRGVLQVVARRAIA